MEYASGMSCTMMYVFETVDSVARLVWANT